MKNPLKLLVSRGLSGTWERNRTSDQKFRKLLLYPLSYPGIALFGM